MSVCLQYLNGFFSDPAIPMNTESIDYKHYYDIYEKVYPGHSKHIDAVLEFSKKLASKYYDNMRIVEAAAILHDIGLVKGYEVHETEGYNIIKGDKYLKNFFNETDIESIAQASVHRKFGTHKFDLCKIVSDSDRANTVETLLFLFNENKEKGSSVKESLYDAADKINEEYNYLHESDKRCYFPETEKIFEVKFDPIIDAYIRGDLKDLYVLLKTERLSLNESVDLTHNKYGEVMIPTTEEEEKKLSKGEALDIKLSGESFSDYKIEPGQFIKTSSNQEVEVISVKRRSFESSYFKTGAYKIPEWNKVGEHEVYIKVAPENWVEKTDYSKEKGEGSEKTFLAKGFHNLLGD